MKIKFSTYLGILLILVTGCARGPTPQPGWYPKIAQFDEVSPHATLPRPAGVLIVDSRPAGRKYDGGHIPGAANIPERSFDTMTDSLPADKADLLIFYCGGLKCPLSHKSAFKAEQLGYSNIKVYAEGFPDWKEKGGLVGVGVSHIKKQMEAGSKMILIDSRPKARKYDKGHIPGAISIPDSSFAQMTDKLPADKTTPLYFYCGGLKCKLSPNSANKAIKLGFSNVQIIPEGYPGWVEAYGKGDVFKMPEIKSGKDSGTISVVSFEQIYKTAPETLLLVDVRDPEEFARATFKGAINIPIGDMEKRMDELTNDRTIIFFCGTAGRAGEAYDMMQMFKPELKTYFLNAEIDHHADGSYAIKALD